MDTHPSLEYALVGMIAAAFTYLLTPVARAVAIWWGAVALPRDRDVHAVAMPRMGGPAMFLGF
jgi:UDP-GlcNAc:undecaprenyl-phosphate GlcNAc-1-phosphate transferase